MKGSVFLDSGIFIALMNRSDRWHPSAVALFSGPRPRWCTSYLVISEAYSWFLHRMGEEAARSFRQLLEQLPGLRVFEATSEHHGEVCRMLDRLRGSKLTYVDASSLSFLQRHKIDHVWSTDHPLTLTGASLLPRS